jgi:hypothetical protein
LPIIAPGFDCYGSTLTQKADDPFRSANWFICSSIIECHPSTLPELNKSSPGTSTKAALFILFVIKNKKSSLSLASRIYPLKTIQFHYSLTTEG